MNTEEFIKKYKEKFPNKKRSFEKTTYVNSDTKVTVTCHEKDENGLEHGDFSKVPYSHLRGIDCPKCSKRSYSYSTSEIIQKIKDKYGDLYTVVQPFEYKNQQTVIPLYCNKHKIYFNRISKPFLKGHCACPECGKEKIKKALKISEKEFFNRLEKENKGRYDTSKVKYGNVDDNITLICHKKDKDGNEHGEFYPKFSNFTVLHSGCSKCALEAEKYNKIPFDTWIERFKEKHGDKYDLSLIIKQGKIDDCDSTIYPICHKKDEFGREHGAFKTTPKNFYKGNNCPKCLGKAKIDGETWLLRSKLIHNNKYRYIKFDGINNDAIIECPIHGIFKQNAGRHMRGSGCQKCIESHLERDIRITLDNLKINYLPYFKPKFLKSSLKGQLSYDFYLPKQNIAIECQGKQHFGLGGWLNEKNSLEEISKRDNEKKELSKENNVKLIYYLNNEYAKYMKEDDIYFTNTDDLIKYILSQPIVNDSDNSVNVEPLLLENTNETTN